MKIAETLRGALRRMAGVSSVRALEKVRRTSALPSIFNTYGTMAEALPKLTSYNLRKFSETPVARRAINCIKDRIAGMRWRIQPRQGYALEAIQGGAERVRALTNNFETPNPDDSFRSFAEQVLEDVIVGGYGAIEVQLNPEWSNSSHVSRSAADLRSAGWTGASAPIQAIPLLMWPVDGASIRINAEWDGSAHSTRYVQVNDQAGPSAQVKLDDDELIYVRLNPRTHTPFGLGRLEVAFETINAFLGAHRYAGRLASNSVVQYALWLQDLTPEHHERLIRWWQDEIEGTGKVPILSVESKPEVLRFGGGTDADLRLQWQEFLLRVVADAFDLPPFYLGVERDVNRSTAEELNELAFRQAIVPTARLLAEYLTRDAIGKKLGWNDLEFVFADVDVADPMEEAQIQQILLQNGVLTVNEVRRMRGLGELKASS
ncbi:MAG TPA: phage portal protein [Candidatus Sulfotelmatobacter sp.]|nr:phage portal protein [Candidatus Sulfotelmatobacter sp.]